MKSNSLPLEAPTFFDFLMQIKQTRILMTATLMANAMDPPMIPHNALSERPDPPVPVEVGFLSSPIDISVDSVVG